MKRYFSLLSILVFAGLLLISCGGPSDEPSGEATEQPAAEAPEQPTGEAARTPGFALVGEWTIDRGNDLPPGSLTLTADKKFSKVEYDDSTSAVTITGTYVFNAAGDPFTIDFIPGDDPNAAGIEYVTMYGILRFLPDDKLEIRMSTTGERPTEFEDTRTANTMILTRK